MAFIYAIGLVLLLIILAKKFIDKETFSRLKYLLLISLAILVGFAVLLYHSTN